MATSEDVTKLAALARIAVPEEKLPAFVAEFDAILAYVGKLDELKVSKDGSSVSAVRNVLREDADPHAAGAWTQTLAAQFPERERDYLAVKQIISYD